MTRTKICGITRIEDVCSVVNHGADALGFVFYEPSPRNVSVEQAAVLIKTVPAFVTTVGLFVDAPAAFVFSVLAKVPLDVLQFHGDESPEYCQQFNRPYLKAIRIKLGVDLIQCAADYQSAQALLLDAHVAGMPGGTGKTFDWSLIPNNLSKPIILSGGLDDENVRQAIRQVRPYAVDVSSGVELSKGIKDEAKIARFMHEVKQADV